MALIASAEVPPAAPIQVDRSRWRAAKLYGYEYSILHSGGMYRPMAMRIVVTAGQVVSATLLCISPLSADDCEAWHKDMNERPDTDKFLYPPLTIPQLLDYIDHSRTTPNAYVEVELDATYGYPRRYRFDITTAFDDEHEFEVFDFKALQ